MKCKWRTSALCAVLHSVLIGASAHGAQDQDLYKRAASAFQSQDYASAAKLFEEAALANANKTDELLMAAKARVHLLQFEAAENTLRRYLESNPTAADAWYLLGFVLNRENKAKDSLDIYTRAASLSPPSGDDLKMVALDYELLNDNADAIHWLEVAVAKDPNNKEAWYFLGRAYYTSSRLPGARKAFDRVLELSPKDARAENNIGLIYESGGKTDEALTAYRNAIAWQNESSPSREQPYLNLGNLLVTLDRPDEAIGVLRQAVSIAPQDAQGHLRLGTAYLHLNQLKDAERELREAVELGPADPTAHYQLGRCLKQAKKFEEAKPEFDRADQIYRDAAEKLKTRQE